MFLVTAANPPNGANVALRLKGDTLDALPACDTQKDLGMPDLEPRARAASRYRFQD